MDDRERVVALVGASDADRDRVAASLESGGVAVQPVADSAIGVETVDPASIVALDDEALLAIATADVSVPVIACETGPPFAAVEEAAVPSVLQDLFSGAATTASQSVLEVVVDGTARGHAVYDVLLVTTEPAEISEFSVGTADHPVASFRADGIVAATPAGSRGYARSAGGPILGPRAAGVAVVPIAPFRTRRDRWVLGLASRPRLRVERDDEPVSLVCDGADAGSVPPETDVHIAEGGTVEVVLTDP